jgi:hypothetical protein
MGGEPSRDLAMNRTCWWLVDTVSRMLEPGERDVVLGDFAESGESCGRALNDVLGLVVRRQAALWKDWRPWLVLVGLVGLVGWPLGQFSYGLSQMLATYFWTAWHSGVRFEDGLTVSEEIVAFACQSLALISYSWTGGFVLGSLSRRTILVNGALFYMVALFSGGPLRAVYLLTFHGLPLLLQTVLFLLPSTWGVYVGFRQRTLGARPAIILASAIATMTLLAAWTGGWWQTARETWSGGALHEPVLGPVRLLLFALVSWPAGYMLATARWRRWHDQLPLM